MPSSEIEFSLNDPVIYDVRNAVVEERISELFEIRLTVLPGELEGAPHFSPEMFVGQSASFVAPARTGGARRWTGVCHRAEVSDASALPSEAGHRLYRNGDYAVEVFIVPQLWLLTQRRTHRIFQHTSIPKIVGSILAEWNIEHEMVLDFGSYPELEYRVQHGESDFAFISRLLEEAGVSFSFATKPGMFSEASVLVLSDRFDREPPSADPLAKLGNTGIARGDAVFNVRLSEQVRPGATRLLGYDFRKPATRLTGSHSGARQPDEAKLEQSHFVPGAFLGASAGGGAPVGDAKGTYRFDPKHGSDLSARMLAAMRADRRAVHFETSLETLTPGLVIAIQDDLQEGLRGPLMVTDVTRKFTRYGEARLTGRAIVVDPESPFRPSRKTPKPVAQGIESATVVGPSGAEIHSDELGRVRVQFPWDLEGNSDDDSSCWIRVSQGWAGAGFGMVALPRVGQEVLVAFLGGDPDQPIIVGRAFNGLQQVPYKLPDNQTVSGWKSQSTPKAEGYNEIKFEDKAGSELLYIRAQRDRHQLVLRDDIELTKRNKMSTVGEDEDIVVGGERSVRVGAGANEYVHEDKCESVGQSLSLIVKGNRDEKIGANHALDVGGTVHLRAGMTLVMEAGARLTIKGPGGFIDFHPGGIDIVGNIVNINSGGSPGVGAGAKPTQPSFAGKADPQDEPVP